MLRENNVVKFIKESSVMRPGYYIGVDLRKKLVILGICGTQTVYDLITDIATSSHEEVNFEGYSTHFGNAGAARWFLRHEIGTLRKLLEKHEDDVIPRLSVASLTRLRNEILQSDWMKVLEKEDWKSVVGLVTNAKQFVTSVQDVARKLGDYAQFRGETKVSDSLPASSGSYLSSKATKESGVFVKKKNMMSETADELFIPGNVYYLKRNIYSGNNHQGRDFFTLLRRNPGEHFQPIHLSTNIISDHKCDTHLYALRDVIKGFSSHIEETIYKGY